MGDLHPFSLTNVMHKQQLVLLQAYQTLQKGKVHEKHLSLVTYNFDFASFVGGVDFCLINRLIGMGIQVFNAAVVVVTHNPIIFNS